MKGSPSRSRPPIARLEAIAADRNSPPKQVWRANIILASADGFGTTAIKRRTGKSKPCVWRWQARFAAEGVVGLLRDKTRPSRVPPLPQAVIDRVIELTTGDPPHEATHWTAAAIAKAVRIGPSSVQRIWRAHRLRPHQLRTFKLSKDPQFAAKLRAIVGLYVAPPAHSLVLSVDEKPQIQALDRTQPGLPMKPGRCATMSHDDERHGTTPVFAALNVLDGTVLGRCMQRHRHQEFLRFLNAVEGLFAKLTRRRLKRGVFGSLVELQAAINRFLAETNADPTPFVWTANPDHIIEKVHQGHHALDRIH